MTSGLIGGMSGMIEISLVYPFDFVKTYMQVDKKYCKMGFVELNKQIYKKNGFLGYYKGYNVLFLFSIPKNITRFSTYHFA